MKHVSPNIHQTGLAMAFDHTGTAHTWHCSAGCFHGCGCAFATVFYAWSVQQPQPAG